MSRIEMNLKVIDELACPRTFEDVINRHSLNGWKVQETKITLDNMNCFPLYTAILIKEDKVV